MKKEQKKINLAKSLTSYKMMQYAKPKNVGQKAYEAFKRKPYAIS